VLNGNSLAEYSIVKKEKDIRDVLMSISIPKLFPLVQTYSCRRILKDKIMAFLNSDKKQLEIKGNILTFKYAKENIDFEKVKDIYKNHIIFIYKKLHGQMGLNEFKERIEIEVNQIDEVIIKPSLIRQYWRAFIDK